MQIVVQKFQIHTFVPKVQVVCVFYIILTCEQECQILAGDLQGQLHF